MDGFHRAREPPRMASQRFENGSIPGRPSTRPFPQLTLTMPSSAIRLTPPPSRTRYDAQRGPRLVAVIVILPPALSLLSHFDYFVA